ncbi:MAG: hypothetical protein EA397_11110 [Deltaproteobacteria bacterium]|nr:MAG: hypothetical protein EA397_11110 [Deltaproteobacteria bacterium]
MKVLIIEDGYEYHELFQRFLPDVTWIRQGSGPEALRWLERHDVEAIFLDLCFDRIPTEALLGDEEALTHRFNGDPVQARSYLQEQQGLFVLAALRAAGCTLPVILALEARDEPARWQRLQARYAPVDPLPDLHRPDILRRRLAELVEESPPS